MALVGGFPSGGPTVQTGVRIHDVGSDPWIVRDGHRLYYTHTTLDDIRIWSSDSLYSLGKGAPASVWNPGPHHTPLSKNIWAPELHCLDGKWYLYFAADDGNDANHRMYVLESQGSALGPYCLKAKLHCPTEDYWAVDGTVWDHGRNRYFIWSGWSGEPDGRQYLYIASMDTPWMLGGRRHLLSTPERSWEFGVNESPQVVNRGGETYILYSADRTWSQKYKLGALRYNGGDPLTATSWHKVPNPLFESTVEAPTSGTDSAFAGSECDPGPWQRAKRSSDLLFACERESTVEEWSWVSSGRKPVELDRRRPVSISLVGPAKVKVVTFEEE